MPPTVGRGAGETIGARAGRARGRNGAVSPRSCSVRTYPLDLSFLELGLGQRRVGADGADPTVAAQLGGG